MSKSPLKFMAALSALVLLVVGLIGTLAERDLRKQGLERTARSLEERARLVRELLGDEAFRPEASPWLDDLANRSGASAGARVTLIAPSGVVVGDSDVATDALERLPNHGDRPEVQAALEGRIGRNARRSETLGRRMFYLAIPVDEGRRGAVRLAIDLSHIEAAVTVLRSELAITYLLSWATQRPLHELRRVARGVTQGNLGDRTPLRASGAVKQLSEAIDEMAEQLQLRIAEVTNEKEQLQGVLNAMVEGVLVVDARNEIILANDRLRELFDAWGEVDGRTPLEAIRHAELDAALAEAHRTDQPISRAISVGRSATRTVRVHAARFPAGSGRRLGTVAVFHDITEITRLEKVRRDFVANASHELRTPLAAIRGFTETLLASPDLVESDRRSYLEVIDRHARRLGNLVGDLLELSRIEGRETRLELAPVDVAQLAENLIHDNRTRFAEKDIEVTLHAPQAALALADTQALEQILTNLLDNAVKYTDTGGRIQIRVEVDAEQVRTLVSDTGIGIPKRDIERIFERFYRVDKARSRALGGTGLGLSIVKHLVQSLGGEITVDSELGKGTTFSFTVPRAAGEAARAPRGTGLGTLH